MSKSILSPDSWCESATTPQLLEGVVANPTLPISSYTLARRLETLPLQVSRPSNCFTAFARDEVEQSLVERFESQVSKDPRRLAVKTPNIAWTYDQLNQMANRIAHSILSHRGEGEERVGLLFDNDAPMIAGLLGVLK